jgi:hypothetical protein
VKLCVIVIARSHRERHKDSQSYCEGCKISVAFTISIDDLSIIDDEGNSFVEAGDFEILVGDSSETTNFQILTVK